MPRAAFLGDSIFSVMDLLRVIVYYCVAIAVIKYQQPEKCAAVVNLGYDVSFSNQTYEL